MQIEGPGVESVNYGQINYGQIFKSNVYGCNFVPYSHITPNCLSAPNQLNKFTGNIRYGIGAGTYFHNWL